MNTNPPPLAPLEYARTDQDRRGGIIRILAVLSIVFGASLATTHGITVASMGGDVAMSWPNQKPWLINMTLATYSVLVLAGCLLLIGGIFSLGGRPRMLLVIAALLTLLASVSSFALHLLQFWIDDTWSRIAEANPALVAESACWAVQNSIFPLALLLLLLHERRRQRQ